MKPRLFARITIGSLPSRTKHYRGLPPDLTGGKDTRQELGQALFLTIEQKPDGVFLYRFDAQGDCVGDTWHETLADAKHQASYEFGDLVQSWEDVPQDVHDIVTFCLSRVAGH